MSLCLIDDLLITLSFLAGCDSSLASEQDRFAGQIMLAHIDRARSIYVSSFLIPLSLPIRFLFTNLGGGATALFYTGFAA